MSTNFSHAGLHFTLSVGFYENGRVGEVFISSTKPGSPIAALALDAAVILSIALQYSADLEVIRAALTKDHDGSPATLVGSALDAIKQLNLSTEIQK
jgi:ribonucleoside-diphosphate reductase alpha chain